MVDVTSLGLPALDIMTWVFAILPVGVILVLMLQFKMSGARAGVISWVLTAVIVYFVFKGGPDVIASGTVKGVWATLFVLFIIWSSMFLYNLVDSTGSFEVIAAKFTELTNGNRILQLLILGWAFPTFIQGVCGFGVPVAIATPLLIGLGFSPMLSVVTALLGHSWGITFGSLGASYSVLLNYTPEGAIDPALMAFWGSIFIAFGGAIVGFCILHNYGRSEYGKGFGAFKEGFVAVTFLAVVMGAALIATCFVSPYLGCFVAGATGLLAGVAVLPKLKAYRPTATNTGETTSNAKFLKAFSAYIILVIIVFSAYLITPLKAFLEQPALLWGFAFPANEIATGFGNAATAKYSALKIGTTPGTLIVVSTIVAAICYKSLGLLKPGAIKASLTKTVSQSIGSTTTVIPMTMMAILMTEGGMTVYIAYGIAIVAGTFYPILAPFIGLLGGFVTSSGTSSNILFTGLQYEVADILKVSPYIILASQTTASSLSNSFSPGNAALGTGVSNQAGKEGEILKITGFYNIIQSGLVGILAYILISMGLGF